MNTPEEEAVLRGKIARSFTVSNAPGKGYTIAIEFICPHCGEAQTIHLGAPTRDEDYRVTCKGCRKTVLL